jgi:serine/threonine-protein kinase
LRKATRGRHDWASKHVCTLSEGIAFRANLARKDFVNVDFGAHTWPLRSFVGPDEALAMAVRKVGSCRVLREIGRGGMSVIYEAYQDGLDRRVAVKALDPSLLRSNESLERFRREGRAYAHITHEAIPAVHDLVQKEDALYLVTEFVDGADLHRVLQGGPLPPASVAAVGARLADALECVHRHALLHRDLKPPNVMITRKGELKLMDFGIAKDPMATELTRTGAVVGTPAYVAPEVLEGAPATESSDLWSLGVTLYEIATGTRPFGGADFHELFASIRKARVPPLREVVPGFPRRLARAVERCLARRPGRRWESAAELAEELEACAERLAGGRRHHEVLAALMVERGLGEGAPGTADVVAGEAPPELAAATVPAAADALLAYASLAEPRTRPRRSWRLAWALAALVVLAGLYAAWALQVR